MKLAVREAESRALFDFVRRRPERISSQIARVEVLRALRRAGAAAGRLRRAEDLLARIALLRVEDSILAAASGLEPLELRSLDAIHLATALSVGKELGVFVSYDRQLVEAAGRAGLSVASPS